MIGWAEFSACGTFRYLLGREWDRSLPHFSWGLLNPSVAGAKEWDPTARKVRGFTERLGGGGFDIWNLFPLIATNPADLKARLRRDEDARGQSRRCDTAILDAVDCCTGKVVVGWGAHAADRHIASRVKHVLELLAVTEIYCLGTTKDGFPVHPLMLPYTARLERVEVRS